VCGITGYTKKRIIPDRSVLEAAAKSIHHRGPDQLGFHVTNSVALAAVRLKILDLAGGDQPITTDDGDNVIVFNGEIYNYRALRAELESLGHRFRTNSDTEVVLHAWLEWDTGFLTRLRGMFAFALWRESEKRLLLARDRMGIKPLYLWRHGEDIVFGSELKTIFAHPDFPRRLNREALNYYLALNYTPQPFTLVEGIEKLEPGGYLEWRDGVTRVSNYWRLVFAPQPKRELGEAKEELDSLLKASVSEHMLSDVPLGVWLSGGLDSSTITHYAAQETSAKLKTFSVSFQGRTFDESSAFRLVASHYGTDHHEFDLSPNDAIVPAIQQLADYSDEPSADAGALPIWFLSKMCRSEVTVALSGEGADELFGGYTTYLADKYARWIRWTPAFTRKLALHAATRLKASDEKIGFEYKLQRFLEGSLLPPTDAHLFWNGAHSQAQRADLLDSASLPSPGTLFPQLPDTGKLNQFLYLDQINYLPDDILYKCDRMSMAHSLEIRPPFLDHRIVEFAAALPENLKIQGSKLKYVLRELMKDKLPAPITKRKKEGFDIPAHHWFRTILRPLLEDAVTSQAASSAGLQWAPIAAMMHDHFHRKANYGYQLWGLLTLFLWIKRWNIQPAKHS